MKNELTDRARRWIESIGTDTATVESVTLLPPAPDGRAHRIEVVVRLDDSTESSPDEDDVREFADGVLEKTEEAVTDIEDWSGPDELYIQLYAPGRDTDAGACGTAHWLADSGYESIEARPFFF